VIIGFDLDGVIAVNRPFLNLPRWLAPLTLLLIRAIPGARAKLRQIKHKGHKIVIVTARPRWAWFSTWLWLRIFRIPHHALYIAWPWQKKLEILQKVGAKNYFDDKVKIVDFLRQNNFNAYLFEGWVKLG